MLKNKMLGVALVPLFLSHPMPDLSTFKITPESNHFLSSPCCLYEAKVFSLFFSSPSTFATTPLAFYPCPHRRLLFKSCNPNAYLPDQVSPPPNLCGGSSQGETQRPQMASCAITVKLTLPGIDHPGRESREEFSRSGWRICEGLSRLLIRWEDPLWL